MDVSKQSKTIEITDKQSKEDMSKIRDSIEDSEDKTQQEIEMRWVSDSDEQTIQKVNNSSNLIQDKVVEVDSKPKEKMSTWVPRNQFSIMR